ncbi:MAG: alpha-glucan family phosphorylase [Desulfotomaculales bacterium]
MFFFRTVSVIPRLPEKISRLHELAYNLWFGWNPEACALYEKINQELWAETGHNPVKFLLRVRQEELDRAARDEGYLAFYRQVMDRLDSYLQAVPWFARRHPEYAGKTIAYFSAEFGLHESHPTYSGGLGLLAGDHCKSASDLGLPLIGVGLLYKSGYFTQQINRDGWQEAVYPFLNFHEIPVALVTYPGGSEIIVQVDLPGRPVFLKIWRMRVGRVDIYFLDADTPQNRPEDRLLTAQLYGGNQETRIAQEILLGLGGVRALRALGINPQVWHINEGHPAFLLLERLRELVQSGLPFKIAVEAVRPNTLFTTHTPVPAGHDVFSAELVDKYLASFYESLGVDRESFLNLGWDERRQGFNMTLLALRLSGYCNGVSQIHGRVSRKMFHHLYGPVPLEEVPVTSVTNGVHVETWVAEEIRELFTAHLGMDWREKICTKELWEKVELIPDEKLWSAHQILKEKMISTARENIRKQRLRNQEPAQHLHEVQNFLDPAVLTIGFARRFATYKRAGLILQDRERLAKLVTDPRRPLQIIFAGKAHPADRAGQELIKQIYDLAATEPFKGRVVFLEDYDINLARLLLQGVDLGLNNPRRPMEASGTSGQKAAVNGVVNCSILDGWWPEAFNGENGFAIGELRNYPDDETQDKEDAFSLYALLEETILPLYYERNEKGLPEKWLRLVKNTLKTIPVFFNTKRMVKEYTKRFYLPAAVRGAAVAAENYALAKEIAEYKKRVAKNWAAVRIVAVETEARKTMKIGEVLSLQATVCLGPLLPEDVAVEIVYGTPGDQGLENVSPVAMNPAEKSSEQNWLYRGDLVMPQGTYGYTVRVRPYHRFFVHPFELPLVTWAGAF